MSARTEYQRKYYLANRDNVLKRQAEYKKTPAGIAAHIRYSKSKAHREALQRYRDTVTHMTTAARYCKTPSRKYHTYRQSAKSRNIPFELTMDQFMTFWQKPCHYCTDPIATIGLDRMDNALGYVMQNVVPCCTSCNKAKLRMSPDAYIAQCTRVARNFQRQYVH